jgi:hypothetical protein
MKPVKNLLNPTPQQIKYRNQLWADALMKNKKKATGDMYDNGGRCCLAVAQDVAIKCGVDALRGDEFVDGTPDMDVARFFGWATNTPDLCIPSDGGSSTESAVELNDSTTYSFGTSNGMSHKKIAECVLNTFVHPKNKVWSFKL